MVVRHPNIISVLRGERTVDGGEGSGISGSTDGLASTKAAHRPRWRQRGLLPTAVSETEIERYVGMYKRTCLPVASRHSKKASR